MLETAVASACIAILICPFPLADGIIDECDKPLSGECPGERLILRISFSVRGVAAGHQHGRERARAHGKIQVGGDKKARATFKNKLLDRVILTI